MKREVRSFWYPTWLAQPAAMIEGSRLIDAPAHDQSWDDIKHEIDDKELIVLHTSTPSFNQDVRTAELIKARNPDVLIGFVGAKVAVEPDKSLAASNAIDFVAREEYDFTLLEIAEGKPLSEEGDEAEPLLEVEPVAVVAFDFTTTRKPGRSWPATEKQSSSTATVQRTSV